MQYVGGTHAKDLACDDHVQVACKSFAGTIQPIASMLEWMPCLASRVAYSEFPA